MTGTMGRAHPDHKVVPVWDLIGHEGEFRLPGGRTVYEAVMRDEARATSPTSVRLCRLEVQGGLHQINRYVDADTLVEVIRDFDEEAE